MKMKSLSVPVCTLCPLLSSNIGMDFPFSSLTSASPGKHFPSPDGAAVVVGTRKQVLYYELINEKEV